MPADPRTTSVSGTGSPPGSSGAGQPTGVAVSASRAIGSATSSGLPTSRSAVASPASPK
jgi:hypothetical protein